MAGSDLMMIVLVGGVLYYLHSTGKLQEIFGGIANLGGDLEASAPSPTGGGGADADAGGGNEQTMVQTGGDTDVDISGENSGASVNGKCYGDPEQCRKAEELLEMIKN